MLDQIFSLAERLIPRLTSAGVVFVLAYLTDPTTVGIYAATILAYTFVQATAETAMRQVLPSVVASKQFLKRYVVFAATVLLVLLLATSVTVAVAAPYRLQMSALALCVVAIAPLFNSLSLRPIGILQLANRWSMLARNQMLAAAAGGAVGALAMFTVTPLLGAALFLPVSEAASAVISSRSARDVTPPNVLREPPSIGEVAGIAGYSGTGWLQGQADRILTTFIAGVTALGSLSVASSIARAVADPMAASASNLLRIRLYDGEALDLNKAALVTVRRSLAIAAGASIAIIAASETAGRALLKSSWDPALDIVPVLSVLVFFSILNSCYGMLQVFHRNLRRAVVVPALALVMAPLVATVASIDLYDAAWLIVLREAFVSVSARLALGRRTDSALLIHAGGYAAVFAGLALLLRGFGF